MKRIINILVIVVFTCLVVSFYAYNETTFANDEAGRKCVDCRKPLDIHGDAVTIEHDGEHKGHANH